MRIMVDGVEWIPTEEEPKAVAIDMWYDRHRREWVLYPVDKEGNQLAEARYAFSKSAALETKKEMEGEL